ncbi:2720_t:CDS:2 [Ambispora gerdemannii]|uniref:2720_t:CDS:1 n=1 Tax=Ambispora gerdemannii TaxID=144530 RepID=A0A9N8W9V6_9GLOM|nr:2720_t:CDS:2 [Ambispora gerdemannii]
MSNEYRVVVGSTEYSIPEAFAYLDGRFDQEEAESKRCSLYDFRNGEYQPSAHEKKEFQDMVFEFNRTKRRIGQNEANNPFRNWYNSIDLSQMENILRMIRTQEDLLYAEWTVAYGFKKTYTNYGSNLRNLQMISLRNELMASEIEEVYGLNINTRALGGRMLYIPDEELFFNILLHFPEDDYILHGTIQLAMLFLKAFFHL